MPEETAARVLTAEEKELVRKKTFERNKWLFSASGIGRDMLYQLIASFLLTYIQFGIPLTLQQFTTLSLIIGVGGRIWDAVNDPMMGAIIEGSHMKRGKFRPWILIGALSCGLVLITMFNIQILAGWRFVVFMSVMYLLWESTFTMNDIGYWAMLPSLSSKTSERNSVTTLTVLFAGVGAIIAQGLIPVVTVGDIRYGYRMVAIIVAAAFIGCQLMCYLGVKEAPRSLVEQQESISLKKMWKTIMSNDQILWMTLSMLFYNIGSAMLVALAANFLYMEIGYNGALYTYIVVAYGVPSVFINAIYPWVVAKLGRRRLQNISILIACVGYVFIALMGWSSIFPVNFVLLCICIVFISCGQSLFYMSSIVNMTNCVEYNEYKLGERNEAVVSTLRPFMAKFASAMQQLIVTLVLTVSGVFLLSQSISTLETQRDFLAKMNSAGDQLHYIECVQEYLGEYDGLSEGSDEYAEAVSRVEKLISGDEKALTYKLNPEYLPALGNGIITAQLYNADGTPQGERTELGRLREFDVDSVEAELSDGSYYLFALEVGDVSSGTTSAADLVFRDRGTLSMRIWLRAAVCAVPIIFLLAALVVQRKKFIIDESYYDMMLVEIEKKHQQ